MNHPPTDMNCDAFRQQLHFRHELDRAARGAFDAHATRCAGCADLLLEGERLDDLLLQWHAPAPAARGGGEFADAVLRGVRGEGPVAGCAETTASLHHLLAGDLEPWLAARVERHLEGCRECADHRAEAGQSRSLWLAWRAPDPAESFADRLIRRLEPETRAARRRRRLLDWALGPIHVPRAAAALVLTSITLLSLGLLQSRSGGRPAPTVLSGLSGGNSGPVVPVSRQTVLPIEPAQFAPGGRGDPTGSLSREIGRRRDGALRSTLRGVPDEK